MTEPLNDVVIEDTDCSPYAAMTAGRNPEELAVFFDRFVQLPPPVRSFLTSLEVIEKIKGMNVALHIPPTHTVAVSKIIAFVALGDVSISDITNLLIKLNIEPVLAEEINHNLLTILEPIIAERAKEALPSQLPELPPMTTKIPPIPTVSTNTPARNIIDLRKQ